MLRELAAHTSAAVRARRLPGADRRRRARAGRPGRGREAARRLADALREAAARVDTGAGPVSLTVSWAVYPEDGTDRFTLMRSLDRGLHASKDARKLSRSRS